MPSSPVGFVKELLREVEYLRADLELLRQKQASMSLDMKQQKQLADTLDLILRDMSKID